MRHEGLRSRQGITNLELVLWVLLVDDLPLNGVRLLHPDTTLLRLPELCLLMHGHMKSVWAINN